MGLRDQYAIKPISYKRAMDMVIKHHYLGRKAPCEQAFGLFEIGKDFTGLFAQDRLVGVITYGTPSSAPLRRGLCGDDEKGNVIELTRLWIEDSTPKNAESFLIGNTLRKVKKQIVVSFAEISAGHIGTVYQASNWIYTGLSAKRTNWTVEGVDLHAQTIADKHTSKELKQILGDKFTLKERPRKHRYVYFLGSRRRRNELKEKLKYPIMPYPKNIKTPA